MSMYVQHHVVARMLNLCARRLSLKKSQFYFTEVGKVQARLDEFHYTNLDHLTTDHNHGEVEERELEAMRR